jgi:hypothetical protein
MQYRLKPAVPFVEFFRSEHYGSGIWFGRWPFKKYNFMHWIYQIICEQFQRQVIDLSRLTVLIL